MAQLERNGHGGDWVTATELFGVPEGGFLDFSSNMAPFGTPIELVDQLVAFLREKECPILSRYPDPEARALKNAIAAFHQIKPEMILPGNGAAELIGLILDSLKPKKVGVIEPAFMEYAHSSRQRKIPVCSLVTCMEQGFYPSTEEVEQLFSQVDLVFIGMPNNPTGHLFEERVYLQWIEMAERLGTWIVLDEAFPDFLAQGEKRSFSKWVSHFSKLIVLRSMTKFFSFPGLRLGYLMAPAPTVQQISQIQPPWSVNSLAQVAGCFVLDPSFFEPYKKRVRTQIDRGRKQLIKKINSLGKFAVFPGQANFLLVRMLDPDPLSDAPALQHWLGSRGILIRDCSMIPGLDHRYFRIAVKREEENQKLINLLTAWAEGGE